MLVAACAAAAKANIVIDTVPVGNPGNAGEWSGQSYGGYGPDRICGAVGYTYNIGKYEVTAGQYTAFLGSVGGVDTYALYNTDMSNLSYGSGITRSGGGTVGNPFTYSVAADFANRPVNYVSYGDSARFANWLHNGQPIGPQGLSTTEDGAYYLNGAITDPQLLAVSRESDWKWAITSEDEWYKAAYYKGGSTNAGYWDYPTGSDTAPGQDMNDVSGNNANYLTAPYAYPIDNGKYTTLVGEFQNSESPYGTFDQGGNVEEWNEAILLAYGPSCGLRGGAFYGYVGLLQAAPRDYWYAPSREDYLTGFRVSEVPEPGTLSILALCLVGSLTRRKCLHR
jgi:formylglycine-generating enzyme required for sulfatase activity